MVTLDQVATMALALPETVEVAAWEDTLTWRTRNKIFVMGSPSSSSISVRTSAEEQAELIAADPETYAYAPYVGRFGWTQVLLSRADGGELGELIIEAWRRTATRKAVHRYEEGETAQRATRGLCSPPSQTGSGCAQPSTRTR